MLVEIVFVGFLATCALTDLRRRLIYNRVLLPAAIFGLGAAYLAGGWPGLGQSLAGMLLGGALLLTPFLAGGMGAGDVKMLAVIGALKGPQFAFSACLAGALIGGAWALALLLRRGRLAATLQRLYGSACALCLRQPGWQQPLAPAGTTPADSLPYGAALALGALLVQCWR